MPSPARVRWAKIRTAAVTVTALFILATLIYLLGGETLLKQTATLYVYIPDATGLAAGSPVRVNGIGVGKVDEVQLSGSNQPNRVVRVIMIVGRDKLSRIPADSTVQLSNDTVVGDKYVDIDKGKSPTFIQPNGELAYKEEGELLKSLDIQQFEKQLRVLDTMLTDIEQGRNRVGQFIRGDQMYKDMIRRVNELDGGLRRAVASTGQVGREVYTTTLYRRIADPLEQFDRTLARLQSGQGPAGHFLRSDEQFESIRASIGSLYRTLADLRSSEMISTERLYTDWDQQVISLIRTVDQFNAGPVFGAPATYENLNGFAKELRDTLHTFREDPRKYLRLKIF